MLFLRQVWNILKTVGILLLILTMITTMIDQFTSQNLEVLLQDENGLGPQLWLMVALSIINSLVFPVLLTMLVIFAAVEPPKTFHRLGFFVRRHLNQLYIENLRAWGSTIRWGILLVVPGLVRMVQLLFVPFVVCLSPEYDEGNIDALEASGRCTRRSWPQVLALVFLFYAFIPFVLSQVFDPFRVYSRTPTTALLCNAVDVLVTVIGTLWLLRIYQKSKVVAL